MSQLTALLPYLRRHRVALVIGLFCILASVSFGLMSPIVVGRAIDALQQEFSQRALLRYAGILIGLTLVQGVFSFSQRRTLVAMSRDIEFELRNAYFAHLERMSQAFYQRNHTGDLMARGTNDLQAVRMLCGPAIMYSSNTVFTACGAIFFMSRIDGRLTLLALSTLPLVAIATKTFGQRIHRLFQMVQEQFAAMSTHVQENLSGVRVVRAYAQEGSSQHEFEGLNREYVERNRKLIRWTAAFNPLLQALVGLGFVAVLWYGGLLVSRHQITVGQFVTFTFFLSRLIWPMIAIGWVINLAQRGSASLKRILEVLATEPEVRSEPGCVQPQLIGAVRFDGLTFSYPLASRPALQGVSFAVEPGMTVAVVGRTGAGKSTLLTLLCRLWDPPPGSIQIDGVDIRRFCLGGLRTSVAVVPQESLLFSAPLRDNIGFGRPEATQEEILRAARISGLEDDLDLLPQGLDTRVGERGVSLSGGQKQRVALARALLVDPKILLLDDCLSAVDTNTEEVILRNLAEELVGRTVFLVSHRISTVQNADLILVLDQGSIKERGVHADLLDADGIYADLHRRQQLEEELAAV